MMDYAYQIPSGVMDSMIVKTSLMRLDVVSVFFIIIPSPCDVFLLVKISVSAGRSLNRKHCTNKQLQICKTRGVLLTHCGLVTQICVFCITAVKDG
jgi:hypothetical protein